MGNSTGATARIRMLREATYNTPPGGNYWNVPFIKGTLGVEQRDTPNPVIGHGSDPQEPLRDAKDGKADLSVPIDARYFGLHLAALLGDPVTTDPGDHYQHVFTSGATGQPTSQAFEQAHLNLAVPQYAMNSGVLYNSMDISFARAGLAIAKFDVIGTDESWSGASGAGTPANLEDATLHYFSQLTGVIKRAGAALGTIVAGGFTFNNNLDVNEVLANNGLIAGADRAEASLSVKVAARFKDMTMLNDGISGTPVQIDWVLSNSADEKLTFTMPKVKFARPKVPLEGAGGIQVSLEGMGFGDASNKMLTATLLNDHAGTAYAAA